MAVSLSIPPVDFSTYACNIAVNGLPLPAEYQVVSAQVKHGYQYIGSLNLVLKVASNMGSDPLANPLTVPSSGAKITLNGKLDFDDLELFSGVVVSQQFKTTASGSRLIIQAKNKAINLAVNKLPEVFSQQSDKDVIEGICSTHGCGFEAVNTVGLFLQKHNQLAKNLLTDWDYANLRAEANGTFLHTEGDKIFLEKPMVGLDPSKVVQATYGLNVFELHQKQDDRQLQFFNEWNSLDISSLEPQTMAEEPPISLSLNTPIQGKNIEVSSRQYNEQELNTYKDASNQWKTLAKQSGTVNMRANLEVKPGYTIEIGGFNGAVDGQYIISSVMHEYGQGGFNTYVQYGLEYEPYAQRFQLTQIKQQPAVYQAIVTSLEQDPENLNRVKIRIPTFNNDTEMWARMAQPYASKDFGMVFHPEIDDEVLVQFLGADYDYPVVIGSLYSPAHQPPIPGSDDNHEKLIQTRSGMKWYWNDEKKVHEISTPAGNKITLSEDAKSIVIEDQNSNTIEMTQDGIHLTSAKDINLKATANVKIEGVNIDLVASGIAKIKGSMVQVN
jgi:Type VI secretion system/phage-baseplate injector OB domain